MDFGTIITFLRGGDEREGDADATENARNAASEEETEKKRFGRISRTRADDFPRGVHRERHELTRVR